MSEAVLTLACYKCHVCKLGEQGPSGDLVVFTNVRVRLSTASTWVMHERVFMSAQHSSSLPLRLPLPQPNSLLGCPTEGNSYSLVVMWRMMCAVKCALPAWLPLRGPSGAEKEGHRGRTRMGVMMGDGCTTDHDCSYKGEVGPAKQCCLACEHRGVGEGDCRDDGATDGEMWGNMWVSQVASNTQAYRNLFQSSSHMQLYGGLTPWMLQVIGLSRSVEGHGEEWLHL